MNGIKQTADEILGDAINMKLFLNPKDRTIIVEAIHKFHNQFTNEKNNLINEQREGTNYRNTRLEDK